LQRGQQHVFGNVDTAVFVIHCLLSTYPTDPSYCWCQQCRRVLPIRSLLRTARRTCRAPPEPRPEKEQTELVEVCKGGCPDYGDPAEGYEMAAVCQLDDPPAYIDTEPCRKKNMVAAYQKRVRFPGGECGPWLAMLSQEVERVVAVRT